jgi:hypothetical protein
MRNKANSRRRVRRGQRGEGQLCETNPICRLPRWGGQDRLCETKPIWPAEIPQHSSIPLFQHSNPMPIVRNKANCPKRGTEAVSRGRAEAMNVEQTIASGARQSAPIGRPDPAGLLHVGVVPTWHGLPAHESSAGCRCHKCAQGPHAIVLPHPVAAVDRAGGRSYDSGCCECWPGSL